MDLDTALVGWERLLGCEHVLTADEAQRRYGRDTNGNKRRLLAALRVQSADVVPSLLRIAARCGVHVYPISTGNNWGYGSAQPSAEDCVLLDMSPMNRILRFDAQLGVVTIEPGVTQAKLSSFLLENGHPFLVPVTGAGPNCSLLSNALERGYGVTPHTDHFGACTDLAAVLSDGSMYRTSLAELAGDDLASLYKWGVGPYTAGLFTQSGLGVVTQMSIALARRPEVVQVCLFGLKDHRLLEAAVAAIQTAISRTSPVVGAINLMNRHRVLAMTAPYPHAELGSDGVLPASVIDALGHQYQVMPWTGFATLYGTRSMVAAARSELRRCLSGIASRMLFLTPDQALTAARITRWIPGLSRIARTTATLSQALDLVRGRPNETALPLAYWRHKSPPPFFDKDPARDGCGLIWYSPLVPIRPHIAREMVEMITRTAPRFGLEPLITLTTLNDRLFDSTVPLLFDRSNPAAVEQARRCYDALFGAGRQLGCVPYRYASDQHAMVRDLMPTTGLFNQRLRQSLDNQGVLSPGRLSEAPIAALDCN